MPKTKHRRRYSKMRGGMDTDELINIEEGKKYDNTIPPLMNPNSIVRDLFNVKQNNSTNNELNTITAADVFESLPGSYTDSALATRSSQRNLGKIAAKTAALRATQRNIEKQDQELKKVTQLLNEYSNATQQGECAGPSCNIMGGLNRRTRRYKRTRRHKRNKRTRRH